MKKEGSVKKRKNLFIFRQNSVGKVPAELVRHEECQYNKAEICFKRENILNFSPKVVRYAV